MAAYVNAFQIAVDANVTRLEVMDVNTTQNREITVAELVLTNETALGLAHKLLEMHNEHAQKMIAGAQANGDAEHHALEGAAVQ